MNFGTTSSERISFTIQLRLTFTYNADYCIGDNLWLIYSQFGLRIFESRDFRLHTTQKKITGSGGDFVYTVLTEFPTCFTEIPFD